MRRFLICTVLAGAALIAVAGSGAKRVRWTLQVANTVYLTR